MEDLFVCLKIYFIILQNRNEINSRSGIPSAELTQNIRGLNHILLQIFRFSAVTINFVSLSFLTLMLLVTFLIA